MYNQAQWEKESPMCCGSSRLLELVRRKRGGIGMLLIAEGCLSQGCRLEVAS